MKTYEQSAKDIIDSYKQVKEKFDMLVKDEGNTVKFEKVNDDNYKAIVQYEEYEIECKLSVKQVFNQMMHDVSRKAMPGTVIEKMINEQIINYLLSK